MKRNKLNKSDVIVILLMICMFCLAVGYSFFAQKLAHDVSTASNTKSFGYWDIRFSSATLDNISGDAKECARAGYNSRFGSFCVVLNSANDSATYDFKITNYGNLDAIVDSIIIVPATNNRDSIFFSTSGLSVGDELDAGDSTHIKVKSSFNSAGKMRGNKRNVKVIINFVQK